MEENNNIVCQSCGGRFDSDSLTRSCGNCFACTNCVIYICPLCRAEIVVVPMKKLRPKSARNETVQQKEDSGQTNG